MAAGVFKEKSDEIVLSLHLFMPFISSAAQKGDSWAKSSVFSKQSVIDELILCGFASERVREKDYFSKPKPNRSLNKGGVDAQYPLSQQRISCVQH